MNIKDQLYDITRKRGSKHFLEGILSRITTDYDLVKFVHRYSVFNGDFAGGVANLAGAYHVRRDLFRDSNIDVPDCADRASEIASHIYFAAEDEYFDRANPHVRITHRQFGQILLAYTLRYYGISSQEFAATHALNPHTQATLAKVVEGYCVNRRNDEVDILRGLGFHLGSELLADEEFNIIDRFLRSRYPELVEYLEESETVFGKNAYLWVQLHTVVETEHFDFAITAAEKTIEYYSGELSKEEVRQHIIDGFIGFADLQQAFFSNILEDASVAGLSARAAA